MNDNPKTGLYVISPPTADLELLDLGLRDIAALSSNFGHPLCFQLWLAEERQGDMRPYAERLLPIARAADIAFLINGDVELAASVDADGVHLNTPEPDAISSARETLGNDAIVGVSCGGSRHAGMVAAETGADYVSFGPVYRTETKQRDADPMASEAIEWWAAVMQVPCVAVGGISVDTARDVEALGADFLALVSSVWDHPNGASEGLSSIAKVLKG